MGNWALVVIFFGGASLFFVALKRLRRATFGFQIGLSLPLAFLAHIVVSSGVILFVDKKDTADLFHALGEVVFVTIFMSPLLLLLLGVLWAGFSIARYRVEPDSTTRYGLLAFTTLSSIVILTMIGFRLLFGDFYLPIRF